MISNMRYARMGSLSFVLCLGVAALVAYPAGRFGMAGIACCDTRCCVTCLGNAFCNESTNCC